MKKQGKNIEKRNIHFYLFYAVSHRMYAAASAFGDLLYSHYVYLFMSGTWWRHAILPIHTHTQLTQLTRTHTHSRTWACLLVEYLSAAAGCAIDGSQRIWLISFTLTLDTWTRNTNKSQFFLCSLHHSQCQENGDVLRLVRLLFVLLFMKCLN